MWEEQKYVAAIFSDLKLFNKIPAVEYDHWSYYVIASNLCIVKFSCIYMYIKHYVDMTK